MKLVRLIKMV